MKDIDFDELDRAVNSLMSPQAASQKAAVESTTVAEESAESSQPTVTMPAEVVEETESQAAVNTDAPASPTPVPPPAPAVATSRGRFMDVVRPSGRDTKRPMQVAPTSRRGVTLQPSDAAIQSLAESESTPPPATAPASSLDAFVANFEDTFPSTTPDATMDFETVDEAVPLSSPFLPDAKVEKRPLGRPTDAAPMVDLAGALEASMAEVQIEPVSITEPTSTEDSDTQLPGQPLPAELGSELLNIETGADTTAPEPQPVPTPEVVTTTPEATTPSVPAPETARIMAAASIPQQYKVQTTESPAEAAPAGIYDTQPLLHPPEKKPGWVFVVAIIGILILGAAGGAAVYYLGLL